MRITKVKLICLIGVAVVLIGGGLWVVYRNQGTRAGGPGQAGGPGGAMPAQAQGAAATALPTRVVSATTTVAADGELELFGPVMSAAFETTGKVSAVYVTPGQTVKKGELLAELDPTTLSNTLQQAQQSLVLQQLQVANSISSTKQTDIDVARANLASAYAAYNELKAGPTTHTIEQALRSYNEAKNSLYSTQLQRDQVCGIKPGQTSDEDVKIAKTDTDCKAADLSVQGSEAQVASAYQDYLDAQKPATSDDLTKSWSGVASAQANLTSLLKGATAEQMRVYQVQISQTQVTVDRAQRSLTKTKLYSPCDCVVQAVNLNVGADAGSGVELMDMSQLRFHTASLNEQNVVKLEEGQKVQIRLKAFDKTFTGKVSYIIPMSTSTSDSLALFTAIIELDETDSGLLPGMTGQATIYLQ
jgi:multidrug efflux pump subunit AcrA (membrane-fusion protein)